MIRKSGPLELIERPLPEPGPSEGQVGVQACGTCHSDSLAVEGVSPGTPFPIMPGYEIADVIDARSDGVVGSILEHASGSPIDSQNTLAFSVLSGVRPKIETVPLQGIDRL